MKRKNYIIANVLAVLLMGGVLIGLHYAKGLVWEDVIGSTVLCSIVALSATLVRYGSLKLIDLGWRGISISMFCVVFFGLILNDHGRIGMIGMVGPYLFQTVFSFTLLFYRKPQQTLTTLNA